MINVRNIICDGSKLFWYSNIVQSLKVDGVDSGPENNLVENNSRTCGLNLTIYCN